MRSIRISGLTALASAVAVALTAIPFSGFASGPVVEAPQTTSVVPASTTAARSAGTINLTTSSTAGLVTWDKVAGTQEFTGGQKCEIVPAPETAQFLDIVGYFGQDTGTAGFRDGNIGVFERLEADSGPINAAQCSRVDAGSFSTVEKLGVHLGGDLLTDTVEDIVAAAATVSLYAQSRDGRIGVALVKPNGDELELDDITFARAKSGALITERNGPTDVTRKFAHEGFIGLRFTAETGSFSLRAATFDLVTQADAFFGCGVDDVKSYELEDLLGVRLIGTTSGEDCDGFGIQLGRDGDAVYFYKPLDVSPDTQFVFNIPWNPIAVESLSLSEVTVPTALIDFEVPGADPEFLGHEMPFCPDYLFDDNNVLVGLDEDSSPGDQTALAALDMEPDWPEADPVLETQGTQFACVGARNASVTKVDVDYELRIVDTIYLVGDARMSLK